jgi:hypothetical protein
MCSRTQDRETQDRSDQPVVAAALILLFGVFGASLFTAPGAMAQALKPAVNTEPCDPAAATALYNPNGDEAAACARRTYRLPAADTVRLRQDRYDTITIAAWDSAAVRVETVVVARRATADSARADLEQIRLRQRNGTLEATGPSGDAPGWWSVGYRLRVPRQTTLDIVSNSAGIDVSGVLGAHTLRSDDGRIRLTLPAGAGARLDAQTDYGTIDVGFPVTTQGAISERLAAVVGAGGPTIRITTGADVTIRRE